MTAHVGPFSEQGEGLTAPFLFRGQGHEKGGGQIEIG
jgi:hypothetical protein